MSSMTSNYAKNIDFFDAPRVNVIPVALKTHTQMHNRTAQNAAVAGKTVSVRTKKKKPDIKSDFFFQQHSLPFNV